MMRLESVEARCSSQGCRAVVNLHDYPEALHDPCGEVVCDGCWVRCEICDTPTCPTCAAITCAAHPTCTDCAPYVPGCRDCAHEKRTA